jgi:phage repressor protein C with HTH and peptisase S24 domain
MQSTLSERLKMLRQHAGFSQTRVADLLGIRQASYNAYESGNAQIGPEKLQLLHHHTQVNLHWLLTGEGEMLPSKAPASSIGKSYSLDASNPTGPKEPSFELLPILLDRDESPIIKVVTLEASAGYFTQRDSSAYWDQLPSIALHDPRFRHGTYLCFPVRGDSMEPTLAHGDLVICRFLEHWRLLKPGYVYVTALENDLLVKRLRYDEAASSFTLQSDNKFYPPMQLASLDVRQLWEVEMRITMHLPAPRA